MKMKIRTAVFTYIDSIISFSLITELDKLS